MIVNIGGGTTDVAVMSLGGIIEADAVRIGGDEIDEAIVSYLKRKYGLIVTVTDAEELKKEIGTLHPSPELKEAEVIGRDAVTGLPTTIKVKNTELSEVITEQLSHIVDCIKSTLEKLHPELCSDIHDYGITLTGGGALLGGIAEYFSSLFGFEVKIAENPLDCCVEGIQKVIDLFPEIVIFNTK